MKWKTTKEEHGDRILAGKAATQTKGYYKNTRGRKAIPLETLFRIRS